MDIIKRLFYTLLQCTWGIIQTLAGALMFLVLIRRKHFIYRGCVATEWRRPQSASVGIFIFVSDKLEGRLLDEVIIHEYGHTIQSIILGPLYFPVIGIPSAVWCMFPAFERKRANKGISYYSFYPERWANHLGSRAAHEQLEIIK